MRFGGVRYATVTLLTAAAALGVVTLTVTRAHDKDKHPSPSATAAHVHAAVPDAYAAIKAPGDIWTSPAGLVRGQTIHNDKCAVCHGRDGAGDGPAEAGLALKPPSLQDKAIVAEMTDDYWFGRVSVGGAVGAFKSAGSTMPAWKDDLSVDDRWAVVAYQHSLSGHRGPHTLAEHPEMAGTRPHPEPRGVAFTS